MNPPPPPPIQMYETSSTLSQYHAPYRHRQYHAPCLCSATHLAGAGDLQHLATVPCALHAQYQAACLCSTTHLAGVRYLQHLEAVPAGVAKVQLAGVPGARARVLTHTETLHVGFHRGAGRCLAVALAVLRFYIGAPAASVAAIGKGHPRIRLGAAVVDRGEARNEPGGGGAGSLEGVLGGDTHQHRLHTYGVLRAVLRADAGASSCTKTAWKQQGQAAAQESGRQQTRKQPPACCSFSGQCTAHFVDYGVLNKNKHAPHTSRWRRTGWRRHSPRWCCTPASGGGRGVERAGMPGGAWMCAALGCGQG